MTLQPSGGVFFFFSPGHKCAQRASNRPLAEGLRLQWARKSLLAPAQTVLRNQSAESPPSEEPGSPQGGRVTCLWCRSRTGHRVPPPFFAAKRKTSMLRAKVWTPTTPLTPVAPPPPRHCSQSERPLPPYRRIDLLIRLLRIELHSSWLGALSGPYLCYCTVWSAVPRTCQTPTPEAVIAVLSTPYSPHRTTD
jgi:hypothetical protein